jgi:hypothetical protein
MAASSWQISGQYYETCSCDFICPCITGQMTVAPSKGSCTFAMGFLIDRGRYGDVPLDRLGFLVLGFTPEAMIKGNWSVGVIVDERASAAQRDAIVSIASGSAGGPMSVLSGLVGKMLGVTSAPIRFERLGNQWSVISPGLVDMAAAAVMGVNPNATEPMHLDNTGHPANDRLALARASKSHVSALGLSWNDTSGRNNGHLAPFSWQSA